MEKLFISANNYLNRDRYKTKFIALRYGNVLGSSGSVLPKFIDQIKKKEKLTITDLNMTRFSITMNEALDFIFECTVDGRGSEIFVPKLRSYSIIDLKDALIDLIGESAEAKIPIRPGEKMHEILINDDEIRYSWEYRNKYVIFNPTKDEEEIKRTYKNIKRLAQKEQYYSGGVEKIPKEELKSMIKKSGILSN